MERNTISVRAHLVSGAVHDILEQASPKVAIEEYLSPDTRPPVESLVITAVTIDGKELTLMVSPKAIHAEIK